MKKIFLLLLIISLTLCSFISCVPTTPSEGEGEGEPEDTSPGFTTNRVVLVELFNAVGCGASEAINPILEELAQEYGTDQVILVEEAGWGKYSTPETMERFSWYVTGTKHTPFVAINGLNETLASVGSIGGGGGGSTPAPTPPEPEPEPEPEIELIEVVSKEINLNEGGIIEITDPENELFGLKLIIEPITKQEKRLVDEVINIVMYIGLTSTCELPEYQGYLITPIVIQAGIEDMIPGISKIEIPYNEKQLINSGVSKDSEIHALRTIDIKQPWEELSLDQFTIKDNVVTIPIGWTVNYPGFYFYTLTVDNAIPPDPNDFNNPLPGDLLYKFSKLIPFKINEGWLPGHVGIYVGERYDEENEKKYNVIEALLSGVQRTFYEDIQGFGGDSIYLGAREPEYGLLHGQRNKIVALAEAAVGSGYAAFETFTSMIYSGLGMGEIVKGPYKYNCVGLAEGAYEYAGVDLVSDYDEGNQEWSAHDILTPAEQWYQTVPASGVIDQNTSPEISGFEMIPENLIEVGSQVTITCNATDQDQDILTYEWLVPDETEPIMGGKQLNLQVPSVVGNYQIICRVFDNYGGEDIEEIEITVGDVNHTPVITSTAVTSATKAEPYSYDVNATDSDGDTLFYSLTTKPSGMNINSSTGLIAWTPTTSGDYNVTVKVSDGELFDTQSFTITVSESPPPTKTLTSLTVSPDNMSFSAAGQTKYISEITLGWLWSDGTTTTSSLALGDATYSGYNTLVAKIVIAIPNVKVESVGEGSTNIKVSYTDSGVTKYDYIAVTVAYPPPDVPDLVISSLTHFPASPTTVDQITFTAVVKNIGTGPANASTLSFKVGGESIPPTFSVPILTPGATHTVERQSVLGVAQSYIITVTADVNNDVIESDESNNQRTDTVVVTQEGDMFPAPTLYPIELEGYVEVTESMVFTLNWTSVSGADEYRIDWAIDSSDLSNFEIHNPNHDDTWPDLLSETIARQIEADSHVFYWRVRAQNQDSGKIGYWSNIESIYCPSIDEVVWTPVQCDGEIPEITEVIQTYWESWSEPYDFSLALSVCLVGSPEYDLIYSWFESSNTPIWEYYFDSIIDVNFYNNCKLADVNVKVLKDANPDYYFTMLFHLEKIEEGWKIYDKEESINNNGTYALRDIGPAGGLIFYDKGSYSDGWRYMEAAPVSTEWPGKEWGSYGTLIGGTETGIGSGQSNTTIIVTWLNSHSETDRAAQVCDALVYGGYSDWFFPSRGELNLMYENLKLFSVGGFANGYYWSSSEDSADRAGSQNLYDGNQYYHAKYGTGRVRAARAF